MQNQEIRKQLQRLQTLIKRVDEACGGNIEMQSHWAKYICILSAGVIENALREFYTDYAVKQVSEPVGRYVSSTISPIKNPKIQKFLEIASAFQQAWRDELEIYANLEGRGDAINSIMTNRHQVAHGKSHISNITLAQLKEYLAKAVEVLEFIDQQCNS